MKRWGDNVTPILPERLLHAYVDVLLPATKRRAVRSALIRQPELRETVEVWRKQNADLQRLALLDTPGPMPATMAGVAHRLETRLRRFAPLEGLRIAATVALLMAGIAGAALMTQTQLDGGKTLISFSQPDIDGSQPRTKPIPADTVRADTPVPAATVVVTVDAPPEVRERPLDSAAAKSIERPEQIEPPQESEKRSETPLPPATKKPEPAPSIAETPKPDEPPRNI